MAFALIQFKVVQYCVFSIVHLVTMVESFEMKTAVREEMRDAFGSGRSQSF